MIANLEYYKVFYHVAIAGSLTIAAQELNISQPAVSQSLKQLEGQLGISLFYRVSRGVRLTEEGARLYEYVARSMEALELGEKKVRQMRSLESGEIRIGASDMTLRFYLLPYLERFHERYPGVKVNVTNAPTPETLRFLEEEKIDFGIVSTPFEAEEKMISVPVREIEDVFVAGRRFFTYKNKMLDLQELERLPLIFLEQNTSSRSYMDTYLRKKGVTVQPEFELATSDMIVQFVLRNLGVGCVVRDFAREEVESGRLFELRFNQIIPERNFCVVYHKKGAMSLAAGELMKIMGVIRSREDEEDILNGEHSQEESI